MKANVEEIVRILDELRDNIVYDLEDGSCDWSYILEDRMTQAWDELQGVTPVLE